MERLFKDNGFTLVEIVIYLAVISVMSVSIIGIALQVVRIKASTNAYTLMSSESSKVFEELLYSVRNCESFAVVDSSTLEVTDNSAVTKYYIDSSRLYHESNSIITPITTDEVEISDVAFVDWTSVNSSDVLSISFSIHTGEYNESYQTTVTKR